MKTNWSCYCNSGDFLGVVEDISMLWWVWIVSSLTILVFNYLQRSCMFFLTLHCFNDTLMISFHKRSCMFFLTLHCFNDTLMISFHKRSWVQFIIMKLCIIDHIICNRIFEMWHFPNCLSIIPSFCTGNKWSLVSQKLHNSSS